MAFLRPSRVIPGAANAVPLVAAQAAVGAGHTLPAQVQASVVPPTLHLLQRRRRLTRQAAARTKTLIQKAALP